MLLLPNEVPHPILLSPRCPSLPLCWTQCYVCDYVHKIQSIGLFPVITRVSSNCEFINWQYLAMGIIWGCFKEECIFFRWRSASVIRPCATWKCPSFAFPVRWCGDGVPIAVCNVRQSLSPPILKINKPISRSNLSYCLEAKFNLQKE